MSSKLIVYGAATVGSILGSMIPSLWHADLFSFSSILFSGIGGIAGILIALKFINY